MKWAMTLCISLSACFMTFSQNFAEDLESFKTINQAKKKEKNNFSIAKNNTNELQIMLSAMFLFYKKNISSQDASRCAFHVSCSEFALQAIKKQGLIIGSMNFFDRFTRCNTCSPYQYSVNAKSHRFEDQLP
jgi:uncharacterized protein